MTISFIPCDIPYFGLVVDDECIADKDQQIAYLDPYVQNTYKTYLYSNYETFDSEQYNE